MKITKQLVKAAYEIGIIKVCDSVLGGTCAKVGNSIVYFGGEEGDYMSSVEYMAKHPKEDIVDSIYNAIQRLEESEYIDFNLSTVKQPICYTFDEILHTYFPNKGQLKHPEDTTCEAYESLTDLLNSVQYVTGVDMSKVIGVLDEIANFNRAYHPTTGEPIETEDMDDIEYGGLKYWLSDGFEYNKDFLEYMYQLYLEGWKKENGYNNDGDKVVYGDEPDSLSDFEEYEFTDLDYVERLMKESGKFSFIEG